MTLLGFIGAINFLGCILLAVIVLCKGRDNSIAIAYAILNSTVGGFSLLYFFWQLSTNSIVAYWLFVSLFIGVVWINQAYLYFILVFLKNFSNRKTPFIFVGLINLAFSFMAAFGLLFSSVEPRFGHGYWPVPSSLFVLYLVVWHLQCIWGFAELILRLKFVSGLQKEQLKYLILACAVGYLGGATNWPMWFKINFPPYANALIFVYDGIIAYSIVRHRLMDISLIIRKTILYSIVAGTLVIIYWLIVTGVTQLLQGVAGSQTTLSSAIAAALITFLFQPLRKKVQLLLDRKFFRQYVDREEKLYELSREVVTHTTPEAMADAIMRVLGDTLHPKGAALFLKAADGNGFVQVFSGAQGKLPDRVPNEDPLPQFFIDHPQPFVQDASADQGSSFDTRRPHRTGESA